MHSRGVKRTDDVALLRAIQFLKIADQPVTQFMEKTILKLITSIRQLFMKKVQKLFMIATILGQGLYERHDALC